ncbi:Histone-lysine N-methyltransferase ATX4 [Zea mays]|uniref:Histone-lysine N-methyltransferase ATX4 n=1 Tax=Zea mays TaxID=4577 RepID=A0A1D6EV78_MAIZE|nr:Histone-lysine N-methyltransferase ATX4 [Zea mays]
MMDGVTLRHLLRPFAAQEAAAAGRVAAAPEQLFASHSTLQSGPPPRVGPSNELLTQVPGNYCTFDLAPDLTRANASNAAGTIDFTRAGPSSSAATLPKYPRHGLPASSSNEQSSFGALFPNRSANGMGIFTCQSSANEGIANVGVQFQDSSVHGLQKLPFKSMTHQHPTLPGDRIRVTCMNVGGEFFVGEAGLFGVICLCHRLRMSVAKFCEHAGGIPEKAGEIVCLENGMSIAQWFKFCIGVGGSIANTRWDWPEWAHMKSSPEEHILKSLASRNSGTGKMGLLSRYGKITGHMNKPAYSNDLSVEGGGHTNVEKLVNRTDETYYRKSVDVHETFTKNSALLQNSAVVNLGPAKNHPVHAFDLNPLTTPSGSPHFEASMGRHYNGNHLAHSHGIHLEKNFDASFCNPMPRFTGVMNHDSRACRPNFSNKTFQDTLSNASNTELKLGQSSYHQSMTTLSPLGQSTMIEFQKPQTHRPPINQNPSPKQATKISKSLSEHNEPSISTGNKKQPLEVVNGMKRSEGDELTDDTSKNSFISLFLSHLERNNTPEPIDDILNSNEHYLPKALDVACGSDHPESATRQIETRVPNDKHSKLASAIVHTKRRSEGISLSVASSGYNPQDASHANSQEHLIHGDSLSHLLPSQPNTGISKISARVSCHANCMSCIHVGNKSHQVAHGEIGVPCFYDKMARGHGTFERVDDCTHRSLRAFTKISCDNGKSCCSSRELLPSFCQNDQPTLGKSICGCCCKIQEDASKLGFIPGHMCRTHFSSDVGPVLANKPTIEGLDEFCACSCSTFTQRSSLCSREYVLQSSCDSCPINGLHCRSCMGHAADSLTKHSLFDPLNTKERGSCCNGRCCYSVVPKCLSSCDFTKHCDVIIDQIGHAAPKDNHQLQMPTRCCTLGENEKLICQCLSNKIAVRNLPQTSHCKDVSEKVMNQPSIAITERLENVSEPSVADDSSSKAVAEKKDAYRDSAVSKGQPNFGFSSGSSSIIVTKFQKSPEFNNVSSTAKHSKHKNLCDEGSRIEKSSASSYVPTSTGCEEPLNSSAKSELGPSRVKRKCNQISEGRRLEETDNEEHCSELLKKTRTLRCSVKGSESDDCTRASSQSSQKGVYQPQNEVNSFSCRVLRTKRKHPIMHLNKHVKQLHRQTKFFEGDEQPDAKGNFLGGLDSYDRKRQVEDMSTLDKTRHHQEGSRAFVRKLPKYVSLNCIVNEPNTNSEGACSGSGGIDSSLIATGITNDNRKSPKIVPLNLVLKKAKRCNAVKLRKTESTHLYEEKSSDCSVNSSDYSIEKYSVDDENCSPQAEYELQDSKRSRYSSNDLRSHVALHKRTSGGTKNRRTSVSLARIKKFGSKSVCYSGSDKDNAVLAHEVNARRYSGRLSSNSPCCVCGISDLEPCNRLIECSKCYIKVHQACYGVLKVPRGQWFCRPCKNNTMDTVCVLCGYGGGAMTRALKTKNILKSLLQGLMNLERSEYYVDSLGNASSECTSLQNPVDSAHGDNIMNAKNITSNSWTSGKYYSSLLGPQPMQWVHMVCGLWTPGTKCPNDTTMSAFDVSGASPAKRNTACSICDRTGGSFVKCRAVNCLVFFHAWCAHQRGLLQSEPEGEHNENIGFYGRCVSHAIVFSSHVNPKKEYFRNNNWTCARTEGFKGRKGEGFSDSSHKKYEEYSGEFGVSQEQINAWLRINGSKPCGRGQEYIHYKQLKGWKHLVVYKSGIHGLGLYTSVFIPRGSMVVEYVGEIVGQRVADRREIEYQSGKRQQYKSACYFFKIDREHIIDATRKGGIARFVNHSCQPNCVAKIISVRNEKKVMFFAERHINPGEEITYDYHFNREDEGQRILCFCRSRYCRRYLN